MEIRPLSDTDDRWAISEIYEESWKFAYRDILPQSYLDSIPHGKWVTHLDQTGMHTLIAVENGEYIGTSSYCESRFNVFAGWGEIVSLYLRPPYMGKGYGKKLLETAITELTALGYRTLFLWVLEENVRARRFYEKMGFVPADAVREDLIGGKQLREIPYCCYSD